MQSSRETIYSTLFNVLQAALQGQVKSFFRRPMPLSSISAEQQPALVMLQYREEAIRKSPTLPTYYRLLVDVVLWVQSDGDLTNAIPAQVVNPIVDIIDATLALDPAVNGSVVANELGILGVHQASIQGVVMEHEGLGTQAKALIPIELIAV